LALAALPAPALNVREAGGERIRFNAFVASTVCFPGGGPASDVNDDRQPGLTRLELTCRPDSPLG